MEQDIASKLIALADEDQAILKELHEHGELKRDEYHPKMRAVHERNAAYLKRVINRTGWPNREIAGDEGTNAAWLIAQHSVGELDFMIECLGHVEKEAEKNLIPKWHVAFLQDRVLILQEKEQIHGTQFGIDENGIFFSLPIADVTNVNERRKHVGLNSLTERLAEMNGKLR